MRRNPYFRASEQPEDKLLFARDIRYPDRYLTKCDTVYLPTYQHFKQFMIKNVNANILWSIRHPYDWCLDKIYRGRPMEKRNWNYSDDGTIDGCKKDMEWMYTILGRAEKDFPMRIIEVKMEDIILDIEKETKKICKHFCILWDEAMTRPWERMRHQGKKKRYGNGLDTSQINLYKNLDIVYNGYFRDYEGLQEVFDFVKPMIERFGYV